MFRLGGNSHARALRQLLALALASWFAVHLTAAQDKTVRFHVVALAEHGGIHKPFVDAAKASRCGCSEFAPGSHGSRQMAGNTLRPDSVPLAAGGEQAHPPPGGGPGEREATAGDRQAEAPADSPGQIPTIPPPGAAPRKTRGEAARVDQLKLAR